MASNLKTRIITALVLGGALFAVVLFLPPNAIIAVLSALVLMGAWEWSGFLRTSSLLWRAVYVLVIAALLPCAWHVTTHGPGRDIFMSITVVWWFAALCWILLAPRRA